MEIGFLAQLAGGALSLIFSFVPKLKDWYNAQPSGAKSVIMILSLVVVAVAVFGLSCAGVLDVDIACDKDAAREMAGILLNAILTNQAVYLITRKLTGA